MQRNITQRITITLAMGLTALAVSMAVASSAGRAATPHAQVLLACLSASIVIATHVAPALLRNVPRVVLWPIWSLCLFGALWSHASFLTSTSTAAAAVGQATSPAAAAVAQQRSTVEQALAGIKARPVATVASQLARTIDPARASALQDELREARRAAALREQLVALAASTAAAAASATADPVSMTMARMISVSADAVAFSVSMLLALVLEVLGMLVWWQALSSSRAQVHAPSVPPAMPTVMQKTVQVNLQPVVQAASQPPHHIRHGDVQVDAALLPAVPTSDLDLLRAAVSRGECQPTLAGIRKFMRCSQQKASDLRAALYSA